MVEIFKVKEHGGWKNEVLREDLTPGRVQEKLCKYAYELLNHGGNSFREAGRAQVHDR